MNTAEYKFVNGTAYHKETPQRVIDVLEAARREGTRIRLYYGDRKTGRSWHEEYDVLGYVARSTGSVKIPILLFNRRSIGGMAIPTHCIVKIATARGKKTLYQHPQYKDPVVEVRPGDIEEFPYNVYIDGKLYARCLTKAKAEWLRRHMS